MGLEVLPLPLRSESLGVRGNDGGCPTKLQHSKARHWRLTKVLLLILACLYTGLRFSHSLGGESSERFKIQSVQDNVCQLSDYINKTRLRERLRYLTLIDRVAGSEGSLSTAHWAKNIYDTAGLEDISIQEIPVYLNYPIDGGRQVAVVDSSGYGYSWTAKLEEETLYGESSNVTQTPTFHAYSYAGNVTGPLVYANYGAMEDFQTLKVLGFDLTGTIALVRYNGTQSDRSLKVKAAAMAGSIGCLIYSDPMEDGFAQGPDWPNGPWRPSDGVQRGSVALSSWVVGDPLTPGWASSENAPTVSKDNNTGLVNIPSLPLAWRDAQHLLQILNGHGKPVPQSWIGAVPDVAQWWTGDTSSPHINLQNIQGERDKHPIYNVFGSIRGWESDDTIYVGNHRDAWCQGASDPGSGTVAMLEVVQVLSEMLKSGWRPRRTITFASWDGEEYNFLGSTEFVEGHLDELRQKGIAYLNVDVGVVGSTFRADGSPLLKKALMEVLSLVQDPFNNHTLEALWKDRDGQFAGLAAGSDYVAFQDIAGISSIDFGFEGPGYLAPYHSCYESFEWMDRFGDLGFAYHKTLVHFWTLLILELADQPLLPFDAVQYADAVQGYVQDLKMLAASNLSFEPLEGATAFFQQQAAAFHKLDHGSDRAARNRKLVELERNMLDLAEGGGVPGRQQYKHILFGPQAWGGYDEAYFPAILDAVDEQDWLQAEQQISKAANIVTRAAQGLNV